MSVTAKATVHIPGGGALSVYNPLALPYGAYGTYKPDKANGTAGIPAGSPTPTVQTGTNGVLVISTAGTYDSIDFRCEVQPRVPGIVFTRCIFRGNTTRGNDATASHLTNGALCNISGSAPYGTTIAKFYDCEFRPTLPSIWWDAILSHDYEAHRCYVTGTVDGFGVYGAGTSGANVALYGNQVGKLSYFSPDPNHSTDSPVSKTHNDVVQWQGGNRLVAVGNNFSGYLDPTIGEANYSSTNFNSNGGGPNNFAAGTGWNVNHPAMQTPGSVLQISNTVGGECSGLDWHHNWMGGGNRHLNLSQSYTSLGTMHDNVSDRDMMDAVAYSLPTGMDTTAPISLVLSNNTYSDNGAAVAVRHL